MSPCWDKRQQRNERLLRTFQTLDANRTGAIPLSTMENSIDRVMPGDPELTAERKRRLISHAEQHRGGYMDFEEFSNLLRNTEPVKASRRPIHQRILFRTADMVVPVNQRESVHNYLREYGCRPPPFFMLVISIAEIAVFLYYSYVDRLQPGWIYGCPGCRINGTIGPLVYDPTLKYEAWRYVSYMFIHSGIEHLLGNVALQLALGIPLELVHKFWRVGPLYTLGVVVGALLQSAVDPYVALVGASGGGYALLAAHLSNVILNWKEMPLRWVRLLAVLAFSGVDVSFAVYRRYYVGASDKVSHAAHLGGALTGLLLGIVILKNVRVLKWERLLWWICLVVFGLLVAGLIVLNILYNVSR